MSESIKAADIIQRVSSVCLSPAVDSTMNLAVVLAVMAMMAALATAHPAQHKLHQVEILLNPQF